MSFIDRHLHDIARALRRDVATLAAWISHGPLPAPDQAPARCGCTGPLIWDSQLGCWRHLRDLSRCDPRIRPR